MENEVDLPVGREFQLIYGYIDLLHDSEGSFALGHEFVVRVEGL